jgi:outer membrane protein OmpA-like peptidoglycan-associated protein
LFLLCGSYGLGGFLPSAFSQQQDQSASVRLELAKLQNHSVTVRFNLRTYRNGRYAGLLYREARARLRPSGTSQQQINASYFVLEETIHDKSRSARMVDRRYDATLRAGADGSLQPQERTPFPRRRNFPVAPGEPVSPQESWRAPVTLTIDPLWSGTYYEIPTSAAYEYSGTDQYQGRTVHVVRAQYGFRTELGSGTRYSPSGGGGTPGAGTEGFGIRGSAGPGNNSGGSGTSGADNSLGPGPGSSQAGPGNNSGGAGRSPGSGGSPRGGRGTARPPVTQQIDSRPTRAQGSHTVDILIDAQNGRPVLMRDRIQEEYRFQNGDTVRFDGFALTFFDELTPIDRPQLARRLRDSLGIAQAPPDTDDTPNPGPGRTGQGPGNQQDPGSQQDGRDQPGGPDGPAEDPGNQPGGPDGQQGPGNQPGNQPDTPSPEPSRGGPEGPQQPQEPEPDIAALNDPDNEAVANVEVEESDEGVRIRLKQLRFQPDQAVLLPEERTRLDAVADALAQTAPRPLLVVGHTADVGKPQGQQQLSVARAKAIVDALTARGIDPDRLLYEGRGARDPVAPNDTEAGRARNRRVEIHVLE